MIKQSIEREITFEITPENFNVIVNKMMNAYTINISNRTFVIEKPKKNVELHFLSSDDYKTNSENDDSKHRIKFKIRKKNKVSIKYSSKNFANENWYEANEKLGSDFNKAYKYITRMPNIDSVMLKYSYRFDICNHLDNSKIKLSLASCVAINPEDCHVISNPFFYLEIEEETMVKLEDALNSSFFIDQIAPHTNNLEYGSHNKIRKCKSLFCDKKLLFKDEDDLTSYINRFISFYHNNIENSIASNFDVCNPFMQLRGKKENIDILEKGDYIEKEIKFLPNEDMHTFLKKVKMNLPGQLYLIKMPTLSVSDVYFDTNNFALYNSESSYRMRKRREGNGWVSCFKIKENDDETSLERNKIRTTLNNNNVLCYNNNKIPGLTYRKLIDYLKENGFNIKKGDSAIKPMVLLNQTREVYAIRLRYSEIQKEMTSSDVNNEYFHMLRSDLVHIMFDDTKAYDISCLTYDDIKKIIYFNELNIDDDLNCIDFKCVEMEHSVRPDIIEYSKEIFNLITNIIKESNYNIQMRNKYDLSVSALKINT